MSVLTAGFTSCSDNDEDTSPSYADINNFAPADDDQSPTAQLRRDFYKETGCYLFFDDNLTPTPDGKVEKLDVAWSIIGMNDNDYMFDFITDIDEQREAATFVKQHLVKRLGRQKPYSFMLVNDISYYDYGWLEQTTKVLGTRCYVISMSNGEAYEDPDGYFSDMMQDIVTGVLEKNAEAMEPFYAYSNKYYGNYLEDLGMNEELTDQEVWDLGMFSYINSYWGSYFVWKSTDFKNWLNAVFSMNREEFEEQYGSSATMMSKYDTLMGIITGFGFIID